MFGLTLCSICAPWELSYIKYTYHALSVLGRLGGDRPPHPPILYAKGIVHKGGPQIAEVFLSNADTSEASTSLLLQHVLRNSAH